MRKKETYETKEKRQVAFLEQLEKCLGVVSIAAKKIGISREAVYKWAREDQDFAEKMNGIKETQLDFAESKLLANINAGDTKAIIYYLNCKGRERGYGERHEVIAEVKQVPIEPLSDEEFERLAEIRRKMKRGVRR